MPENRKYFMGARFTDKERENIKKWAKKRNLTVSDLFREAISTHIDFLENNEGKLEKVELILVPEAKQ